ncbi:MAG: DUF1579 domain-containing protein [Planctomycetes bacterium]|nr:DUF1579 domain-containing protein [Planctomycetota bacterium]
MRFPRPARLAALLLFALTTPLAAQNPPEPSPQHKKLADMQGRWDVAIEAIEPNGQGNSSKGASTLRLLATGLWLIEDFASTFNGLPFQGHGVTGYDPQKKKYVTTWVDSWTPSMLQLEGDYDKAGKVLTMTGEGLGTDGKPAHYRNVITWVDQDHFTFEMFVTGAEQKEVKVLTMTYTRQQLRHPPK